jgi:hypothetical protein
MATNALNLNGPVPQDPELLYHYTSVQGVRGILTSKSLWASLLHFMNDSKEWLYALDLVRQHLSAKINLRSDKNWFAFIADLIESVGRIEGLNICVFSLTAMPNQLSQWRAYCPPEGGYNISFNVSTLRQHLHRLGFQLMKCVYDSVLQSQIIEVIVNQVIGEVGELPDDAAINVQVNVALRKLSEQLAVVAPILKHPDFKEEQEWRAFSLVKANDSKMDYRIKGSIVIPHCVLKIETPEWKFPIWSVTVGPHAHQKLAMRGLQAIVLQTALNMRVTMSTTPLRNL